MQGMGDWRLRARMQTLGCDLHVLTENANFAKPEDLEEIARQASALAGLAKVFLVLAHKKPQRPYSRPMDANGRSVNVDAHFDPSLDWSRSALEKMFDHTEVRETENTWADHVQKANERKHRQIGTGGRS